MPPRMVLTLTSNIFLNTKHCRIAMNMQLLLTINLYLITTRIWLMCSSLDLHGLQEPHASGPNVLSTENQQVQPPPAQAPNSKFTFMYLCTLFVNCQH